MKTMTRELSLALTLSRILQADAGVVISLYTSVRGGVASRLPPMDEDPVCRATLASPFDIVTLAALRVREDLRGLRFPVTTSM